MSDRYSKPAMRSMFPLLRLFALGIVTFPPEHVLRQALDVGVDQEDQEHCEGLFDRRGLQAAGDQRADVLTVAA
jgi:hypothetical protein